MAERGLVAGLQVGALGYALMQDGSCITDRGIWQLIAAIGVGVAGGQFGATAHRQAQEASRASCSGGVAAQMRELRDLTKPERSPYRSRPQRTPDGCVVDVAVPNARANDHAYVGKRLVPAGFQPDGDDAWVRGDLRVRLRSEEPEGGRDHLIVLTGTRG